MAEAQTNKLAILVGGGPAPGINSVIAAATIRARLEGLEVVGDSRRVPVDHAGPRPITSSRSISAR